MVLPIILPHPRNTIADYRWYINVFYAPQVTVTDRMKWKYRLFPITRIHHRAGFPSTSCDSLPKAWELVFEADSRAVGRQYFRLDSATPRRLRVSDAGRRGGRHHRTRTIINKFHEHPRCESVDWTVQIEVAPRLESLTKKTTLLCIPSFSQFIEHDVGGIYCSLNNHRGHNYQIIIARRQISFRARSMKHGVGRGVLVVDIIRTDVTYLISRGCRRLDEAVCIA